MKRMAGPLAGIAGAHAAGARDVEGRCMGGRGPHLCERGTSLGRLVSAGVGRGAALEGETAVCGRVGTWELLHGVGVRGIQCESHWWLD